MNVFPLELNSTLFKAVNEDVKVAPEASIILVFPPEIESEPEVNVSSPCIWKVPLFEIVQPLSSNSYPANAKVAEPSIVKVPEELISSLSAILTMFDVLLFLKL